MKIGIYPGSFDPITKGHIDIIERAARVVDKLVIGVLDNSEKKPLFSAEERSLHYDRIPDLFLRSPSALSVNPSLMLSALMRSASSSSV